MTRALHGPFGKPGMSACTTVQLMSQVLKPIWNRVPDVRVLHGCTAWVYCMVQWACQYWRERGGSWPKYACCVGQERVKLVWSICVEQV
eukprot:CAMPEP_0202902400 /NCGR_PEP_ID=MMETSP1392-20130828/16831_1 /ASSEMBLY_ACC=CAM_ASM_000868 /TAXON_ID=225041 /ORGANISM="Chlamydomonas chlamydogama, Strain SAG 11-48b" /LENGTH=88 /DNA_ID=CAMNT_0049589157 /DNA_START=406 /DNA_END=672 /DNA_ORIENTATION=-